MCGRSWSQALFCGENFRCFFNDLKQSQGEKPFLGKTESLRNHTRTHSGKLKIQKSKPNSTKTKTTQTILFPQMSFFTSEMLVTTCARGFSFDTLRDPRLTPYGITFVPCIDERLPRRGSHGSEQTFCERGIISSRGILSSSFDFGQTASSTSFSSEHLRGAPSIQFLRDCFACDSRVFWMIATPSPPHLVCQ